jgi:hypothetical protein
MTFNNYMKLKFMNTMKVVRVIDHSRILQIDRAVKSAGKME